MTVLSVTGGEILELGAGTGRMAAAVLENLGETPAAAREAVRRFRQHDERTLIAQYQVKEDEEKFLATSREAGQQLEKLFDADRAGSEAK